MRIVDYEVWDWEGELLKDSLTFAEAEEYVDSNRDQWPLVIKERVVSQN